MNMLKILCILLAAVVFGGMTARSQTASTTNSATNTPPVGGGKIEVVGGDTYDWGTVPPGTVKAAIEIRNAGTGPLTISGVVPSCGCTAAPIDKNLLQPGETAKISVSVDMSTRQGQVEKTITVNSDDANNRAQIIRLRANVKRDYVVQPAAYVMISEGKVGVETMQTLRLQNSGDAPLNISAPKLVDGNVKVRFENKDKMTVPVGGEATLTYYVTPQGNKPGADGTMDHNINGTIKYTTSSASMKDLEIKIYGSTAPPVSPVAPTPQGTVMSPAPLK